MKTNKIVRVWRLSLLLLHFLLGLLEAALLFPHRNHEGRNRAIRRWSARLCHILAIELKAHGHLPLKPPTNAVLVANHISWLDIFVINAISATRFVAKSEIRDWPVVGWLCERTGTLFIKREKRHDTARINGQIADLLQAGGCITVFPEGATSEGVSVKRFHASLLQPAVDAQAQILPIALRYVDGQGQRTLATSYVGDTTLWQSLSAILAEPRITVYLHYLQPLATQNRQRRELAHLAEAEIAQVVHG